MKCGRRYRKKIKTTIAYNQTTTVGESQITTVTKDYELHVINNHLTITKEEQKNIVEKDLLLRVKGMLTSYVEKDAQLKYASSLFIQAVEDIGIATDKTHHNTAKSIKTEAGNIEINATDGISFKCGGATITIDGGGMHMNGAKLDALSGSAGIAATAVTQPEIEKPEHNSIRVTKLEVDIQEQKELEEVLTSKATVERFKDEEWTETTELEEHELSHIN
mgnify:CR=1 FL=1